MKNKNKRTIQLLIIAFFVLFGKVNQVSASDFVFYYDDPNTPGSTNFWETCWGNISTDKSSYTVGDTVSVSGILKSTNIEFISSCWLIYKPDLPESDFVDVQVPLGLKSPEVSISGSRSLSSLGMNTPGTYFLIFRVDSPATKNYSDTVSLPITVVSAPSCQNFISNSTPWNNAVPVSDTDYSIASNTGAACTAYCDSYYHPNGTTACDSNVCRGNIPTGSVVWPNDDINLANNTTDYSYYASDTGTRCQYHCDSSNGYVRNGANTDCVTPAYSCTNPIANSTPYQGNTAPTVDTDYSIAASPGICKAYCDSYYHPNGTTACDLNICQGSVPVNASMYANDDVNLTNNTTDYSYWATDTGTRCQYHCDANFTWNASAGICEAVVDAPPVVSISAISPIAYNTSSTLTLISSNAVGCALGFYDTLNDWQVSSVTPNGEAKPSTGALTKDRTYYFRCTNNSASSNWVPATVVVCASGQDIIGGVCHTPSTGASCAGTVPSDALLYPNDDIELTVDTSYSYSGSNTSVKCEYVCKSGFTWDGAGQCVKNSCTPSCNGVWSPCTKECGGGTQTQSCIDINCVSFPGLERACNIASCGGFNWVEVAP